MRSMRIEPATSCNVAPSLASQWRNAPHWHTVWPEGDHWCYPTAEEAADRAVEVTELRAERDAATEAEALREAARDLPGFPDILTRGDAAHWLRERANQIETAPTKEPT